MEPMANSSNYFQSNHRFVDEEDDGIKAWTCDDIRANSEKWSLAGDLGLLAHLKDFSNDLMEKTEKVEKSINDLVFDTKIRCVKIHNVINDFQMLANAQFVENRVYDEEVDEIMANGSNHVQNEDVVASKNKDEEIMPKIQSALNLGLMFLNDRFENLSKQLPQTDSEDEEDDTINGLISFPSKNEFSQRLLPYIIGSNDFIRDNYVGLSSGEEENPIIDLKSKPENNMNDINRDSSPSPVFEPRSIRAPLMPNGGSESEEEDEEEDGGIFGTKKISFTGKLIKDDSPAESSSDESESDKSNSPFLKTVDKQNISEVKSFPSFHDELAAAINKKSVISSSSNDSNETKNKVPVVSHKSELHSDTSDDDDDIFHRNNIQNKPESKTNSSLFDDNKPKTKTTPAPSVIPRKTVPAPTLFDNNDDDDDDDDLFGSRKNTNKLISNHSQNKLISDPDPIPKLNSQPEKISVNKSSSNSVAPNLFNFDDDDDEEDDLFAAISKKPIPISKKPVIDKPTIEEKDANLPSTENLKEKNDDALESSSKVPKGVPKGAAIGKPPANLLRDLSLALKKKTQALTDSTDTESEDEKVTNSHVAINSNDTQINDENKHTINRIESVTKTIDPIGALNENTVLDQKSSSRKSTLTRESLKSKLDADPLDDSSFPSGKSIVTLSNDSLKDRALLGSKRVRRRPSRKPVKLAPITDFSKNVEEIFDDPPKLEKTQPSISPKREDPPPKIENYLKPPLSEKKLANSMRSPSTEEEDVFPSLATNLTVTKSSNIPSLNLFEDNEDSLFSSTKEYTDKDDTIINKRKNSLNKSQIKSALFDDSGSDEEQMISSSSNSNTIDSTDSNRISNIIKSSSKSLFESRSSVESINSNKSDFKNEQKTKPGLQLFADESDDDEDLFKSLSNKTKSKVEPQKQQKTTKESPSIKKSTKLASNLFSDSDEDNADLFKPQKPTKTSKATSKPTTKPLFDDSDDDIFVSLSSQNKSVTNKAENNVTKKEKKSIFDDPLFSSHS